MAAAENSAQNVSLYFPANCLGVISIGAGTRQGTLATYSNWGKRLFFSAQGGDASNPIPVMGISNNGLPSQTFAVGTGFAAPHVAGLMVLMSSIGIKLDSIALMPFSQCDIITDSCNGIISSDVTSPNRASLTYPIPLSTYLNLENASAGPACGGPRDCVTGKFRTCTSSCFCGAPAGSCSRGWCEECTDCLEGFIVLVIMQFISASWRL
jgi:subtilisin family serine protease